MKQRFWLYQRGAVFHLHDSKTGRRVSLATRDAQEAERVRNARNEAIGRPQLGLTLGRAYLAAYDPKLPDSYREPSRQDDSPFPPPAIGATPVPNPATLKARGQES